VATFVNRTNNSKKAMSSFRNNYAHVENTHRAIWPGVEIPEREPRNARKKAAAKPQRQWLAERTCTTSVLMAYFVWAISSFDRGWASRAHACKALRSLLLKLVSALGRLMLTFRPLAQFARVLSMDPDEEQWVDVNVGLDLAIDCWATDLDYDDRKTWLRNPLERGTLDEWLCWALDPSHDSSLIKLLMPTVLCVAAQLAGLLDESVQQMASISQPAPRVTNRKRFTAVALTQKRDIARRMFTGQEHEAFSDWVQPLCQEWFADNDPLSRTGRVAQVIWRVLLTRLGVARIQDVRFVDMSMES
ncbi:hypothetical protein AK812_SmicGene46565, partial [Symbiodinium microadriaticum]